MDKHPVDCNPIIGNCYKVSEDTAREAADNDISCPIEIWRKMKYMAG